MYRYIILIIILLSGFAQRVYCQKYTITGSIIDLQDKKPVGYATISLTDNLLWTVSDEAGKFTLKNVPGGKTTLTVQSLGYTTFTLETDVKGNMSNLVIRLQEDNLALDEVVVTATQKSKKLTTSYTIDRTTLDHAQILNIADISSLLPGGKSPIRQELTTDQRFTLRSETSEKGNASFGTAIEVDGVRLQNNAAFDETKGVDMRNIPSTNIESVEVITGIPSVEHGDLSGGLVSYKTKKGKAPLSVTLSTTPNNKQVAASKGFAFSEDIGTLNAGFEHTKSISDPASPHTSYDRNGLSLRYAHTLNKKSGMPLSVETGLTGNIGGYDSKADPDAFLYTYDKAKDNTFRGNITLKWLLDKSWISNITFSGAIQYADKRSEHNANKSSSSSQASIHSLEEGYFIATKYEDDPEAPIILRPTGYWYELSYHDSKPVSYTAKLKADWNRRFGSVMNKIMIGSDWNCSGNKGKGIYYDSIKYAPSWREYRYDEKSFMHNIALYAEEKVMVSFNEKQSKLEVSAGIRSDITFIKDSEYGAVQSLSPRFNAKYTFWEKSDRMIRDFNVYAGWGKAVKLPSFEVLYPRPSYSDDLAFAPGTMANGSTFYAYYTIPSKAIYNPNLKWQYNEQIEIGSEINIKGVKISLSIYRNKTYNPYILTREYVPYTYKLTEQGALENCVIPSQNRQYTIDRVTGIVTVSDISGTHESQQLAYMTRNDYKTNSIYRNGSPIERKGVEWTIDFPAIPSIRTSFRLDGNYYYYKGTDETLIASKPSLLMANRQPFKYIGYYIGSSATSTTYAASSSASNGSISKSLNTNLTSITHIPKIRTIFTAKLEASLYNYSRRLSEYGGKSYGFVLNDSEGYFGDDGDIYKGDVYVGVYPLYYSTWEDPETKIPFEQAFINAKENDPALYNELAKLVVKSNTNYYFNPNKISAYLSANISVTKEIGKFASISFYANNFFNNMAKVKASNNNTESTLYNSSYIPRFSYGLSLRLKL